MLEFTAGDTISEKHRDRVTESNAAQGTEGDAEGNFLTLSARSLSL